MTEPRRVAREAAADLHQAWWQTTAQQGLALQALTSELAHLREGLTELTETLDAHHALLYVGNGHPALKTQLELVRRDLADVDQSIKDLTKAQKELTTQGVMRGHQIDGLLHVQKWLTRVCTTLLVAFLLWAVSKVWQTVETPPVAPPTQSTPRGKP